MRLKKEGVVFMWLFLCKVFVVRFSTIGSEIRIKENLSFPPFHPCVAIWHLTLQHRNDQQLNFLEPLGRSVLCFDEPLIFSHVTLWGMQERRFHYPLHDSTVKRIGKSLCHALYFKITRELISHANLCLSPDYCQCNWGFDTISGVVMILTLIFTAECGLKYL